MFCVFKAENHSSPTNSRSHTRHLICSVPKNEVNCLMILIRSSVFEFPLHCKSFQKIGIPVSPVQTQSVSMFISFFLVVQFVLSRAKTIGSFGFMLASVIVNSATFL